MKIVLLGAVAFAAAAFIACGGGSTSPTAAPTNAASPVVTVAPTAVPVFDTAWATEQVTPVISADLQAFQDQDWSGLYDNLSAASQIGCSRSEFVGNLVGDWFLFTAFGGDKVLAAEKQDLQDGTLAITFNAITADSITYVFGTNDPATVVREDGKWLSVDDSCGKPTTSTAAPTVAPVATLPVVAAPTEAPIVVAAPTVANGHTALCNDGSYSDAATHQGACSRHGGVAVFYK